MSQKEWAKKEIELAKLAEYENPTSVVRDTEEATLKARAVVEIENAYAESVYDAALELFNKLCDQNHSGMSINLTMSVLTRLVKGHSLTPLQGTDDEWGECQDWGGEDLICQNQRNSAVFKNINKLTKATRITYNGILIIINDNDIWHNYPPLDEPGTLDDEFPATKRYIAQANQLKLDLEAKIEFPYIPITHYYKWNFETEELEEVKEA